jgi:UDP-N-acetylglucosamine--N-acetylmuramyl-(pentapeptide) pyrophosphoryl-undecaprenol N-acetylglucosamine transferase
VPRMHCCIPHWHIKYLTGIPARRIAQDASRLIAALILMLFGSISLGSRLYLEKTQQADVVSDSYGQLLDHGVRVAPFIEDMAEAYAWADLVLCRAGALTVAELAIMGRPAILVPLPHAIDDHQNANARSLTGRGAGILLPQGDMSEDALAGLLQEYLSDPQRLSAMATAATAVATPDAAERVSDYCEELMHV